MGLGVGLADGFFGIGGGFLIVPALIAATAMPFAYAVGPSLVVVTALGLTTATSYALSGHVYWLLTALLIAGGVGGAALGILLRRKIPAHTMTFDRAFPLFLLPVGLHYPIETARD